ncbi:GGDEF domain-containing protein [Candidatus Margulisiibacteriota bacterium]
MFYKVVKLKETEKINFFIPQNQKLSNLAKLDIISEKLNALAEKTDIPLSVRYQSLLTIIAEPFAVKGLTVECYLLQAKNKLFYENPIKIFGQYRYASDGIVFSEEFPSSYSDNESQRGKEFHFLSQREVFAYLIENPDRQFVIVHGENNELHKEKVDQEEYQNDKDSFIAAIIRGEHTFFFLKIERVEEKSDNKGFYNRHILNLLFRNAGQILKVLDYERKLKEEDKNLTRIKHDAAHDDGTGLLNRFPAIYRLIDFYGPVLKNNEAPVTITFLDVDKFKRVVEIFTHLTASEILRHIADVLKEAFPEISDTVALYAGDEIMVFQQNDEETSIKRLKAFRKLLARKPYILKVPLCPEDGARNNLARIIFDFICYEVKENKKKVEKVTGYSLTRRINKYGIKIKLLDNKKQSGLLLRNILNTVSRIVRNNKDKIRNIRGRKLLFEKIVKTLDKKYGTQVKKANIKIPLSLSAGIDTIPQDKFTNIINMPATKISLREKLKRFFMNRIDKADKRLYSAKMERHYNDKNDQGGIIAGSFNSNAQEIKIHKTEDRH